MPPHTISPTPDSQGLGISYSTMSPPAHDTAVYGFTGMGVGPRPPASQVQPQDFPVPHSPKRVQQAQQQQQQHIPQGYSYQQPQFQHHSPPRHQPAPQQYQALQHAHAGRPPTQPVFALRPTHTRKSSAKGFTSFSSLPPANRDESASSSQAQAGAPLYQFRPVEQAVRRLPVAPPQNASVSTLGSASSAAGMAARAQPAQPTRTPSSASNASKGPKRSRSTELFRKFSKNETISGGRYVPLSGVDDGGGEVEVPLEEGSHGSVDPMYAKESPREDQPESPVMETASPVQTTPKATRRPLPRQPSTTSAHHHEPSTSTVGSLPGVEDSAPMGRAPSRSSTASSSAAEASRSQAQHSPAEGSADSHLFKPSSFPDPPAHPPRSLTQMSDPSSSVGRRSQPVPYFMSRSQSQPLNLQSVPESDREGRESLLISNSGHDKRASQVSTGIHSKNAALFSAESGGMMLAFSPSGDATWREGELICGARTGLIPTPQSVPVAHMPSASTSMQAQASGSRPREDPDEDLKSRPWSESTYAAHGLLGQPQPTFLRKHGRSHSDGAAMLARQGTLFYPTSSNNRASQELGVMLGGRKRRVSANQVMSPPVLDGWAEAGGSTEKVRLEASKKRKARVEVDVVLERECVVEGGEVRGRMEVRVTGGKRSEGLRIGGGKIRVVGFEEISSSSRHIFYHQAHGLPLFAHPPHRDTPRSSLFASPADEEGFHLAAEGSHAIPFRMTLPPNGGAKGSYTSTSGKGPCVRYVVVGSVKIHVPSTGKRSIAHFYRQIVVLPYLNPAVVLAPSLEPIEARVEKGLGWSLGGEKGRVEVRVALGRRSWVSGQRIWCEVAIRNDSTKKIKSLHLALLQTVQTFTPQPMLETSDRRFRRASFRNRDDMGTPDADACQTSTTRRKVNEEVMEADFADKGAGRVTGKGWWTGVEAGEEGHWDLSILVPPGMLSVRRTRLIEVLYNLRVTVNGSIYVDVPVTLINFLSIDPPPMPSDGPRLLARQSLSVTAGLPASTAGEGAGARGPAQRMKSSETLSTVNPAKASSTTLHLDALLQAGRARAEIEANGVESAKIRPMSMMSEYTVTVPSAEATPARPKPERFRSFLSGHSVASGESAGMSAGSSEGHDEQDKALQAARRAQGRQRSLAALDRATARAQEANEAEMLAAPHVDIDGGILSPMEEEYKPFNTPAEVSMPIVGGDLTPGTLRGESGDSRSVSIMSPMVAGTEKQEDSAHILVPDAEVNEVVSVEEEADDGVEAEEEEDDENEHAGNETILDELVSHHSHDHGDELEGTPLSGEYGGYDYAEEEEGDGDDQAYLRPEVRSYNRRKSLPRQLPQLNIDPRLSFGGMVDPERDAMQGNTRSFGGSFAVSAVSENESEVGQVYEAIKRNVSIKTPSRLLPLAHAEPDEHEQAKQVEHEHDHDGDHEQSEFGASPARRQSNAGLNPQQQVAQAFLSVNSAKSRRGSTASPTRDRDGSLSSRGSPGRRGSAVSAGLGMRRESSNPPISSPLRPTDEPLPMPGSGARVIQKKSSFSFATPGSPLKVKVGSLPRSPHSPGISPRTANPGQMLASSPSAEPMLRMHSGNSALRHVVRPPSASPTPSSDSEQDPPGLAPSIASDSASSEGHLESPPVAQFPDSVRERLADVTHPSAFEHAGLKHASVTAGVVSPQDWRPEERMLHTQVAFLHIDPHAREEPASEEPSLTRRLSRVSRATSDDHSTATHETSHSILPGVRNKIAQLESRDEALRKFSIASIASNYAPVAPAARPLPVSINSPRASTYSPRSSLPASPAMSPTGRKSYTTALAPRAARCASEDTRASDPAASRQLGGTTYIRPRQYRESMTTFADHLDPFGLGEKGLQRNLSNSSTSTSATAIEAAFAAGSGRRMGPRMQGSGSGFSPRSKALPRVPSPAGVAEETDDSEGLL